MIKKYSSMIVAVSLLGLFSGCAKTKVADSFCREKRGAIDIGSGSTKIVAALVNTCDKKIEKILFEDQVAIPFSEMVERSSDRRLDDAFIQSAAVKMNSLLQKLKDQGVLVDSGVATSVFRTSSNGIEAVETLSNRLGLKIHLISQEEEAKLGYWSALAKRPVMQGEQLVVWDIGGGSMQIVQAHAGRMEIFEGKSSSVHFKNRVMSELLKKNHRQEKSPNPLGPSWSSALKLSEQEAARVLPKELKSKIPKSTWVGIGGVLARSVREQTGGESRYTQVAVTKALEERSTWTDEKIGGDYAATDITNLALVAGYMKVLGLEELETVSVSLGQGWILSQLHGSTRSSATTTAGAYREISPSALEKQTLLMKGPHLVKEPPAEALKDRLLVAIGGTGSLPSDFLNVSDVASSLGYGVILLDYPNEVIPMICHEHPAKKCFDHYREEIIQGRDVSPHVKVDSWNSILFRLRQLVGALAKEDSRSWAGFWDGQDLRWDRVTLVGHSQGAGHAAYLGKMFKVQGIIMFSGPHDITQSVLAPWVSMKGKTPRSRYSALLHRGDYFGLDPMKKVVDGLHESAPTPKGDPDPLVIVLEREVHDPHNAVLTKVFAPEWAKLLRGLNAEPGRR